MKSRRWLVAAVAVLAAACTGDGATTTTTGGGTTTTAASTSTSGPTTTVDPTNLPDLEGRQVRVAVDHDSFPFNYIDEPNGPTGWDYEVIPLICEALGCTQEFVVVEPEQVLSAVGDGTADLTGDGTIADAALGGLVEFSTPYLGVEQRLVVRGGEDRFTTIEEFTAGSGIVGVIAGSRNESLAITTWGAGRVRGYIDLASAIDGLVGTTIDAVLIDDFGGQGYVGEHDLEVKQIDGVVASGELALAFTPSSDLTAIFNAALTALIDDGTLSTINAFWFAPASAS
ncbi:MAG TPA: transporter substrate-binding domain-containing protein [Acidimicrobiia bacterium]|nr:transporter substrate-binding domain-containing protein [Acidimicrobiia bacterium]